MDNKVYKKYNTNNLLHPFKRNRVNKILVSTNNSYLKHYSNAGDNSYVYANISSPDYLMLNDEFMSYAYIYVNGDTQTYYKIFENYSYTYTESFNEHCPKIMKDNNTYILLAYDFVTGVNDNNIIINYNVNPNPHNNQTNVNEFSISYSFKNINGGESSFDGTYILGNSIGISPAAIKSYLGNSSYATIINEFTYSYVNNNHEIVDDGISVSSFDDCIYVWDFKDNSAEVSYAEGKLSAYINIAYSDELYDTTKNIDINTLYSPELIIDNFNPIENQTFVIEEHNPNDNKIKQEIDTTSIIRSEDSESLNDILNKPSLRDNSSLYTLSGKIRGKSNCLTNAINEYNYNDEGFNNSIYNLKRSIAFGDVYLTNPFTSNGGIDPSIPNRNLLPERASDNSSNSTGSVTFDVHFEFYKATIVGSTIENNQTTYTLNISGKKDFVWRPTLEYEIVGDAINNNFSFTSLSSLGEPVSENNFITVKQTDIIADYPEYFPYAFNVTYITFDNNNFVDNDYVVSYIYSPSKIIYYNNNTPYASLTLSVDGIDGYKTSLPGNYNIKYKINNSNVPTIENIFNIYSIDEESSLQYIASNIIIDKNV